MYFRRFVESVLHPHETSAKHGAVQLLAIDSVDPGTYAYPSTYTEVFPCLTRRLESMTTCDIVAWKKQY